MLKVALEGLLGDPPSGKEGIRDAKIGSMRRKGSLALEKDRFKRTGHCPVLRDVIILTERMKNLSEGMRNLNVCVSW